MVLSVELPQELWEKLETRAAESGYPTIEDYVQTLLRAETEDIDLGAPDSITIKSQAQLEALLLERTADARPGIEATPEFWRQLRERARKPRADAAEK